MSLTTPVLFLPGTLCDERIWLPVWRHLNLTQRRYVPLQWATTREDMMALTGDRVLPGDKVHLVGYSMGGYIAARYALSNPSQVASLTLLGYDPHGLSRDEITRRKQLLGTLNSGQFNPAAPGFIERFVHPDYQQNDEVATVLVDMAMDLGKNTLLAHTKATTPREDLTTTLKQAPFAVNILGASADAVVPKAALDRAAEAISATNNVCIQHAAHMMLLEQPETVAGHLQNWLA